ncbi:MAG: RNA-dependent DNA polymerase [Sulfitobacter sp.]|nr:RNA-dependent DNA polymerase [Sulfitobacter sp.]
MKRSAVSIRDVADWHNLAAAFRRAATGKGQRDEVRLFRAGLDGELARLRLEILGGTVEVGRMRCFRIRDPKPRIIHAPCFRERVLHHALIAHVGPVLDRALVDDTFACRLGKGALAAVKRAQAHARRFPWYAKIDIRAYFASIDHETLLTLLERRFKDAGLLRLLRRIIDAHHTEPGKGLPIGALTSQNFANYYLSGLDRLLLEDCAVRGLVRYMDDLVWWGDDRAAVRAALDQARVFTEEQLSLDIKTPVQIGRSRDGLSFCGYRILPGRLLLSRRRKRRYAECRREWEDAFAAGLVDAQTLQAGLDCARAITAHADAAIWRREQLHRRPLAKPLAEL